MATEQAGPGDGSAERRARYDAWFRQINREVTGESVAGERGHETDVDRCQNCGAHVSGRFRRVFGDNADRVWTCPECGPNADRSRGAGALEDPHPL